MNIKTTKKSATALSVLLSLATAQAASAQSFGGYASELGISSDQLHNIVFSSSSSHAQPAWSLGSPTGYTSSWGTLAIGAAAVTPDMVHDKTTALAAVAVGFGNSHESLGGSITIASPILNPRPDQKALQDGSVGLSLGHTFSNNVGIKMGVENAATWGYSSKVKASAYVATSYYHLLSRHHDLALIGTVGLGNKRFKDNFRYADNNDIGGFGSLALQYGCASIIADYSSKMWNAGLSIAPFKKWPVVLTAGAMDISSHLPGNHKVGAFVSVSSSWHFAN